MRSCKRRTSFFTAALGLGALALLGAAPPAAGSDYVPGEANVQFTDKPTATGAPMSAAARVRRASNLMSTASTPADAAGLSTTFVTEWQARVASVKPIAGRVRNAAISTAELEQSPRRLDGYAHVTFRNRLVYSNCSALMAARNDIASCTPNYMAHITQDVDDEFFNREPSWGLDTGKTKRRALWAFEESEGDNNRMDIPRAWDVTFGARAIVFVGDTGVAYEHPDLAGNRSLNPGETGEGRETNNVDDDGNGYVDDWQGWDFFDNDNDPFDEHLHGTHVAGTIAAVGDNRIGVVGVAPAARYIPLRVLGADGRGADSGIFESYAYAADLAERLRQRDPNFPRALAYNASFGGQRNPTQAEIDAVRGMREAGIILVAAAGNENSDAPFSPAVVPGAFAVAATDHDDLKADFSNFGDHIKVAAPGGGGNNPPQGFAPAFSVLSTAPDHTVCLARNPLTGECTFSSDRLRVISTAPGDTSTYVRLKGTSMAAPHVTGLAALLISAHLDWTPDQVEQRILETARDLGAPGFDATFGFGRIDAGRALAADVPPPSNTPPEFVPSRVEGNATAGTPFSVTLLARDPDGDVPISLEMTSTLAGASFSQGEMNGNQREGTFTWTPANDQTGTSTVQFRVRDSRGADGFGTLVITVAANSNARPPFFDPPVPDALEASAGFAFSLEVIAKDPGGDQSMIALAASGLPAGAVFINRGNGRGTLDWMPTLLQVGSTFDVTFAASHQLTGLLTTAVLHLTVTTAAPSITSFSPDSGPVDTLVEVIGRNFRPINTIEIAGVAVTPTYHSPTNLSFRIPQRVALGHHRFLVLNAMGIAESATPFHVTSPGPSTPQDPSIGRFDPTEGRPGVWISIFGSHFTNPTQVEFTGPAGFLTAQSLFASATQLLAKVPDQAVTGPIRVTTSGGRTATSVASFTVTRPADPPVDPPQQGGLLLTLRSPEELTFRTASRAFVLLSGEFSGAQAASVASVMYGFLGLDGRTIARPRAVSSYDLASRRFVGRFSWYSMRRAIGQDERVVMRVTALSATRQALGTFDFEFVRDMGLSLTITRPVTDTFRQGRTLKVSGVVFSEARVSTVSLSFEAISAALGTHTVTKEVAVSARGGFNWTLSAFWTRLPGESYRLIATAVDANGEQVQVVRELTATG